VIWMREREREAIYTWQAHVLNAYSRAIVLCAKRYLAV
jgi:hypothetical protein